MTIVQSATPTEKAGVLDEKAVASAPSTQLADSSEASSSQAASITKPQSTHKPASSDVLEANPNEPLKKPPPQPLPQCKPTLHPALTPDQQSKYDELLNIVSSWTEVPTTSAKNAPKTPITDAERLFLTCECLQRYLRAVKWASATAAATRLLQTLTWRREYGLYGFTADYISPELETGKQVIFGFDNEGRPCLYLIPSRQNTERSDRQLHSLFWMLERCIDLMPPGQETVAMLINFNDTKQGQGASVSQGRQTTVILQNHYPERLGRALISELPWYINVFFKAISAFIDPVTRSKMKFNEPLSTHVPKGQLLQEHGGDVVFEYDHSVYWPAMHALADERRSAAQKRWESAGKHVGESEFYLKGAEGALSVFASAPTGSAVDELEKKVGQTTIA